ncbi:MerR family transcriptional regulator [Agrococcus terreus]|uniref:Transcriptional regulator, MerR family protein n=1 Tax=Agrococcus terreus TaxID=574649 RepID=A0ABQ2KPE9_9MICO|nr:MerR family transcriptional regulator [Agrococcus terreus]GGN89274.1 transcriptional regulator, MerR family protein [Agrococcus terreus]
MPWSTRELAELAGTTVNTVRHYHQLQLLPEPERRVNGYKQYGVGHLVQLLRIRRLVDLGVPLGQIEALSTGGAEAPDALRAVDDDLAQRIEHLQQAREDIRAILDGSAPADGPRGFEAVASRLSVADSSILHIYSQLYDEDALADLRTMVEQDIESEIESAFQSLAPETDEAARIALAEQMAPGLAQHLVDYPWLNDPTSRLSKSEGVTQATFVEAVVELYNEAQLEVLGRASVLARALLAERGIVLPEPRLPGAVPDPS